MTHIFIPILGLLFGLDCSYFVTANIMTNMALDGAVSWLQGLDPLSLPSSVSDFNFTMLGFYAAQYGRLETVNTSVHGLRHLARVHDTVFTSDESGYMGKLTLAVENVTMQSIVRFSYSNFIFLHSWDIPTVMSVGRLEMHVTIRLESVWDQPKVIDVTIEKFQNVSIEYDITLARTIMRMITSQMVYLMNGPIRLVLGSITKRQLNLMLQNYSLNSLGSSIFG